MFVGWRTINSKIVLTFLEKDKQKKYKYDLCRMNIIFCMLINCGIVFIHK